MPVLFNVGFTHTAVKSGAPARRCRVINPATAAQFSAAFNQLGGPSDFVSSDTEELNSWFYSCCQKIMDSVAPLKTRQPKAKPEPWFNESSRVVKRECRQAEQRLKKDKLQESFQILKFCWHRYQNTVKEAKREYFANIVSFDSHNPRVLFRTIDTVLNTPLNVCLEVSPDICNNFLSFFLEKVGTTRALITAPDSDPSVSDPRTAVFTQFDLVTLSTLEDVVRHIKPAGSPRDPVPPQRHFS